MKIGFLMGGSNPEAQLQNPVTLETIEILRSRGADVDVIQPRLMNFELSTLRVCHDLYVIKSIANPAAAAMAATLHSLGAATFNPFPVVACVRNKIATLRLLMEHGVPIPATWVGVEVESLGPLLSDGPIIVKPYMGSRGVGVRLIEKSEELFGINDPPPILAQRFHPSDDGLDNKISFIDGAVFGVKRVFPIRNYSEKLGSPLEIDDETRDIACRISKALSIDMFTFDLMISGGKRYVVDVGAFGSMMGVPNAASLVASRIIRAWEER